EIVFEMNGRINRPVMQAPVSMIAADFRDPDEEADSLGSDLKQREQEIIIEALHDASGCRKNAAEKLGISPRTLRYKLAKMREAGIRIPAR
ncbi:MAG: sigma-54-dependent Fis family transcriptional regulator, partial [Thiotrichales bacterium]|nr:sigma-54-dependent Fis family transcriptional regulator [Thiotrichales bacterium]